MGSGGYGSLLRQCGGDWERVYSQSTKLHATAVPQCNCYEVLYNRLRHTCAADSRGLAVEEQAVQRALALPLRRAPLCAIGNHRSEHSTVGRGR